MPTNAAARGRLGVCAAETVVKIKRYAEALPTNAAGRAGLSSASQLAEVGMAGVRVIRANIALSFRIGGTAGVAERA